MNTATCERVTRSLRLALASGVLALIAACGQGGQPESTADTAPPPAAEPSETPAPADEAAGAEALPQTGTVEESAGTAPPETTESGRKDIKLQESQAVTAPAEWKFREGAHYRVLPAAQGTSSSPDKIEVAEVFWYGCPHCYDLEPVINDWARRQPEDVSFVRIPVMWSPVHEIHARLFYTAQALGKLDEIHPAVFKAFHQDQNLLQDEEAIRSFFGRFGVSAEDFNKTFRSFAVESQLQRAKTLMTRYRVKSVPLLVVNGKYVTDGPEIRNRNQQLELVEELVLRERVRQ